MFNASIISNRLATLLGGIAFVVAAPAITAAESSTPIEVARQLNRAFVELADKVSPSVVVISVAHRFPRAGIDDEDDSFAPEYEQLPKDLRKWFEKRREQQKKKHEEDSGKDPIFDGQGSGVVIRKEGYILTNRHVVEGADKIKVRFHDGAEFDGEVRGVDAQSDVAVVKINPAGKELVAAKLADSDKTRVGEFAVAIGAPFELDYSVTFGHVSAKGRSDILADQSADQDFIQTDANINPGNSGGPLVNIDGEVIGINTLIRGMRTGIGFALPSNLARDVSDGIIADGKFVRGYLGVKLRALKDNPVYREFLTNIVDGVFVNIILPDGPAARSALRPGDVITAVEGRPVGSAQQLRNEIRGNKVGTVLTLDVHRLDEARVSHTLKIKVKPEAWPDTATPVIARKPAAREEKGANFGLTLETVTKDLATRHGVERMDGVMVIEVERGSIAQKSGLKPGDIITELNRKPIKTVKEFRDALRAAEPGKGVLLNFFTNGTGKSEILKGSGD
ncbi:MAG: serine protease Do [Verrucomicrobiota bacterium]